mmetsp:Transcript_13795/g.54714  ORF Transcript_13795/g.54714 Transcript_13795/m.54714 type:complete len:81 (-) Transcript_13795:270-512(-)
MLTSESIRHSHKPCSSRVALAMTSAFRMETTEATVVEEEMVLLITSASATLNSLLQEKHKTMMTCTVSALLTAHVDSKAE